MKVVLQVVKQAEVKVENKTVGKINKGLLLFFATAQEDKADKIDNFVKKIINLRIFTDQNDKLNLSLKDIKGEVLVVSQFTLYGDCSEGRRPSFIKAQRPNEAKELYNLFVEEMKKEMPVVETGIFGAKMEVALVNDGPITFIVDAK